MSRYRQLCAEERVQLALLRYQDFSLPRIARILGRHRSTIWREVRRNRAPYDGGYRSARAHERAVARRRRSRRNRQFGHAEMGRVEALLRQQWSPEQVAGYLLRRGELSISHFDDLPPRVVGPPPGRQPLPTPCAEPASASANALATTTAVGAWRVNGT